MENPVIEYLLINKDAPDVLVALNSERNRDANRRKLNLPRGATVWQERLFKIYHLETTVCFPETLVSALEQTPDAIIITFVDGVRT